MTKPDNRAEFSRGPKPDRLVSPVCIIRTLARSPVRPNVRGLRGVAKVCELDNGAFRRTA